MRGMNEEARTTIRRKLLFIMAFRGVAALAFILGARYLADRIVEWVPAWQGPVEAVLPLVVGLGGGLLIGPIFRMKSRE
jgi:Zn-dependent protease